MKPVELDNIGATADLLQEAAADFEIEPYYGEDGLSVSWHLGRALQLANAVDKVTAEDCGEVADLCFTGIKRIYRRAFKMGTSRADEFPPTIAFDVLVGSGWLARACELVIKRDVKGANEAGRNVLDAVVRLRVYGGRFGSEVPTDMQRLAAERKAAREQG